MTNKQKLFEREFCARNTFAVRSSVIDEIAQKMKIEDYNAFLKDETIIDKYNNDTMEFVEILPMLFVTPYKTYYISREVKIENISLFDVVLVTTDTPNLSTFNVIAVVEKTHVTYYMIEINSQLLVLLQIKHREKHEEIQKHKNTVITVYTKKNKALIAAPLQTMKDSTNKLIVNFINKHNTVLLLKKIVIKTPPTPFTEEVMELLYLGLLKAVPDMEEKLEKAIEKYNSISEILGKMKNIYKRKEGQKEVTTRNAS